MEYGTRYKYPHMAPNDVAIWERFMEKFPTRWATVTYDLALGALPGFVDHKEYDLGSGIGRLYQKKIDVLAQQEGTTYVVEVKPNAGLSALGQVKGYASLYKAYIDPDTIVVPMLITDNIRPDMVMLAQEMGVELVSV